MTGQLAEGHCRSRLCEVFWEFAPERCKPVSGNAVCGASDRKSEMASTSRSRAERGHDRCHRCKALDRVVGSSTTSLTEPQFGPICLGTDVTYPTSGQDEDCLYANVWSPTNTTADSKLPVWLFIQGGGKAPSTHMTLLHVEMRAYLCSGSCASVL